MRSSLNQISPAKAIMGSDTFSVQNSQSLKTVPPGAKIHVIGVCGVAMAQISIALSDLGFLVTGSDKEFYEPMKSLLENSKVQTFHGFSKESVPQDASLVVIGNSISYGNVEVSAVEERKLPYSFFPKLLSETVIDNRHSIVITGTHGKTTTSALVATTLFAAGKKPSYFIGGAVKGLPHSLTIDSGSISVVEGDEYDSAFFAKVPKFFFYKPRTAVITSIEYDHADIYPTLQSIIDVFTTMVTSIDSNGSVICCMDCDNIRSLIAQWRKNSRATITSYGEHPQADVRIINRTFDRHFQVITCSEQGNQFQIKVPVIGAHNARNAVATFLACRSAGLKPSEIDQAISTFGGVKRRQEIRVSTAGVTLIEDFAHHPTAVEQTLGAIREQFQNQRIVAVFEPRSNTSRRKIFQDAYIHSFKAADEVVLSNVTSRSSDDGVELMDVQTLSDGITKSGVKSSCLSDANAINEYLSQSMRKGDVIVVMSNGSFGGLINLLEQRIKEASF